MKELLFSWITKGQYQLTFLDSIIIICELLLLFGIIIIVLWIIELIKENFGGKNE